MISVTTLLRNNVSMQATLPHHIPRNLISHRHVFSISAGPFAATAAPLWPCRVAYWEMNHKDVVLAKCEKQQDEMEQCREQLTSGSSFRIQPHFF